MRNLPFPLSNLYDCPDTDKREGIRKQQERYQSNIDGINAVSQAHAKEVLAAAIGPWQLNSVWLAESLANTTPNSLPQLGLGKSFKYFFL